MISLFPSLYVWNKPVRPSPHDLFIPVPLPYLLRFLLYLVFNPFSDNGPYLINFLLAIWYLRYNYTKDDRIRDT